MTNTYYPNQDKIDVSLMVVIVLGVLLRLYFFIDFSPTPISDFLKYYNLASNFASNSNFVINGRPFIFQPLGYPLLLGVVFKIFGTSVLTAKSLNFFLSVISLVFFLCLINNIQLSGKLKVFALSLLSLNPIVASYVPVLGVETLTIFIITVILFLSIIKRNTLANIIYGIMLFALYATRPQFIIAIVCLFVYMFYANKKTLVTLLCFVVLCLTLSIRNYINYDSISPNPSYSGYVLLVNNNSNNIKSGWMPLAEIALDEKNINLINTIGRHSFFSKTDEDDKTYYWNPGVDNIAKNIAMKWIVENKKAFFVLAAKRLKSTFITSPLYVYNWTYVSKRVPAFLIATAILFNIISLLSLLYYLMMRSNGLEYSLIIKLLFLSTLLSVFFFEGQARYSVVTYVLAPIPIALIVNKYVKRK